jgi:hypothetical protein
MLFRCAIKSCWMHRIPHRNLAPHSRMTRHSMPRSGIHPREEVVVVCVLEVAVVRSEVGEVRKDSWKDWVLKQLVEFGGRPCFAWSSVQEGNATAG